jgi:phage terminase large subunit GpA-like protein
MAGDGDPAPDTIGFHISALYSPVGWMSWEHIAREWEAAANDEVRRSFRNTVLGETWFEPGDAPDWQRLYDRREDYRIGVVPEGGYC